MKNKSMDENRRILDGIEKLSVFKDQLRVHTHISQNKDYRAFIDEKFWTNIDRILHKLDNYNFGNLLYTTRKLDVEQAQNLHNELQNMIAQAY